MTLAPNRKSTYKLLAIPALVALAGCSSTGNGGGGGGGGGGTPPPAADPAYYAANVGTMQQAMDAGLELSAHD